MKKLTIFYALSLIALLGLIGSSIIMINQNGMDARLQGWVNLLWLPLPIVILVVDRICLKKFGFERTNKAELYISIALLSVFVLNMIRLRMQA